MVSDIVARILLTLIVYFMKLSVLTLSNNITLSIEPFDMDHYY